MKNALTVIMVGAFLCLTLPASGQIVAIADATTCSGTPPGGTICSNGSGGYQGTGGTPFSVTGIENGSVVLQAVIGSQTSPVYEVVNNTGATLTTLTFTLNLEPGGFFANNQTLNCQTHGGFSGDPCTTTANGIKYGEGVHTPMYNGGNGFSYPVTFTFTGLDICAGCKFDITFASFANGDKDLQTGPVPEGSSIPMLAASGLVLLGTMVMKKKRRFVG